VFADAKARVNGQVEYVPLPTEMDVPNVIAEAAESRKSNIEAERRRIDDSKGPAQPHTHSSTMLLPRIRALPTGSSPAITTIETALSTLRLSSPAFANTTTIAVRHASHKAQGAANSAKDGAGKRLGAKKSGGM
jgi:hypothetical protein